MTEYMKDLRAMSVAELREELSFWAWEIEYALSKACSARESRRKHVKDEVFCFERSPPGNVFSVKFGDLPFESLN